MKFKVYSLAFAFTLFASSVMGATSSSSSSSSGGSRSSFSSGSSTYSKPSYSPSPSPTYSKPSTPPPSAQAPSYSKPTPPAAQTYTKPSPPVAAPPSSVTTNSGSTYTKPTPPVAAPTTTYTKPPTASIPNPTPSTVAKPAVPTGALGQAAQKNMSSNALKQYQNERAEAKTPPRPVDTAAARNDPAFRGATQQYRNMDSYYADRTRYVTVYRERYPDIYRYNASMSPNYGHYDSGFLMGMMLGHLGSSSNNAAWLYAHQNDPWYHNWRGDMERQARDNAELKAKLDSMDREMAQLKSQNVKPTTQALPEGISPSVAIAPEAMANDDEDESHWLRNIMIALGLLLIGALGYFYVVGSRK